MKTFEEQLKEMETMIESINLSMNLCKQQSKLPKNYLRDRKLNWNIRSINSCCYELMDFNNYILNNNFKGFDIIK